MDLNVVPKCVALSPIDSVAGDVSRGELFLDSMKPSIVTFVPAGGAFYFDGCESVFGFAK